jgi:hypothetical protein
MPPEPDETATEPRALFAETANKPKTLLKVLDFPALRMLLQNSRSEDAYSRSALYYAFTGRGKVRRIGKGTDTLILLPHPNLRRSLLVFFPFAKNIHSFSRQVMLLRSYRNFLSKFEHVFLARIPQHLVEAAFRERDEICAGGCRLQRINEETLDWAYPSHDVSLERLADPVGRDLACYRKKARKFDSRDIHLLNLKEANPDDVKDAIADISLRWILTKSKSFASRPERRSLLREMLNPYHHLASLSDVTTLEIDGFILKRGNDNLAFSFWEKPRAESEIVSCMAALQRSHEKGLSEYLYFCIARTLVSQGYKTMCIGGSETAELDHFKRKLAPIDSHHLHTLEFHPDCRGA